MIIINVKNNNIDRALQKYKKRVRSTHLMGEYRKRQEYIKPSVLKRQERTKAAYKQRKESYNERY